MKSWTSRAVDSPADPALAPYTGLTEGDLRRRWEPENGLFIAEGHLVIERSVRSHLTVESVLTAPRWLERLESILGDWVGEVLVAEEDLLRDITGFRVHRGALAVVRRPPLRTVTEILDLPGPVLVLEELVDATNVGLAIRSAAGLGIGQFVLSPGCADPLYRRAVKSSMGAVLSVAWARSVDWDGDLAKVAESRHLIALTPTSDGVIDEVLRGYDPERVALLVGSEGPGVSDRALRIATAGARIPMHGGVDSLNVAAATAVGCFALDQARRQR